MKNIALIIVIALSLCNVSFATASNKKKIGPETTANVVIDYNNGAILFSNNPRTKMYPASLTKIMTLYVLYDKLHYNELSFDTKIKISKKAAAQQPSKLGLPPGSLITVKDAILAIIIKSSNDIAYAVAEHIAGNEKNFAVLMNNKAHELGLKDTNFANSTGLHNDNQYTTALDMAKLSRVLMIEYNAYYALFSLPYFRWNKTNYLSNNSLLKYEEELIIDGIKTGYTRASGYNLVSSAQKNNIRVIAVTMGAKSNQERTAQMKDLLEDSFNLAVQNRLTLVKYLQKPPHISNFTTAIKHNSSEENYILANAETLEDKGFNTQNFSINLASLQNEPLKSNNLHNPKAVQTFTLQLANVQNTPTNNPLFSNLNSIQSTTSGIVNANDYETSSDIYAINKIPYLEQITNGSVVSINPYVNYPSKLAKKSPLVVKSPLVKNTINTNKNTALKNTATIAKKSAKTSVKEQPYSVQVGAFSSYKSALTASLNLSKTKGFSKILPKENIVITRQSNIYTVRFKNFDKNQAYNTCAALKSKDKDCFVVRV
ncbi:D-alanyl-D-alanine carboxypeptidase [Candidatus Hepatincolaceae symbiont of Richtersius coronifer]